MRQNGTDLVRRCATGGAGQGGWCSRGRVRGEVGVCHLSPCARLARQSLEWRVGGCEGGDGALLVWKGGGVGGGGWGMLI